MNTKEIREAEGGIKERLLRTANRLEPGQAIDIPTIFLEIAGEEMDFGLDKFISHMEENWCVLIVPYKGQHTMLKPEGTTQ